MDFELTTAPTILFDKTVLPESLSLFNIKLGDDSHKVNRAEIIHTTMESLPPNATSASWRDGKSFYMADGKNMEYLLQDRIDAVVGNEGWLRMASGIGYRIKNKKVVEFSIRGQRLSFYKDISKEKIEKKFGKADRIRECFENYDGTLFNTDFIYFKRKMRIFYQDWDKEIDGINIGDSLTDYRQ